MISYAESASRRLYILLDKVIDRMRYFWWRGDVLMALYSPPHTVDEL